AILRAGCEARQRTIAGDADLPEHQIRRGIDASPVQQHLARFEMLSAVAARIDAEIRVQAIFGGDSRLHVCGVTFAPRLLDGFVRDAGEDAWMAIERAADAPAGAHFG